MVDIHCNHYARFPAIAFIHNAYYDGNMGEQDKAIFQTLFELQPSAQQSRQMQIVAAAIENYASVGFDKTTFDKIAQTCGVSRPLINRYFKSKKEILTLSLKYIRVHMQNKAITALQSYAEVDKQLKAYIESVFEWVDKNPKYAETWLLFFYHASIDEKMKDLSSQMNGMGHMRLTMLIQKGIEDGLFSCKSPAMWSKWIQSTLTGALVTLNTEELTVDAEDFKQLIIEECFSGLNCPVPSL